MPERHAGAAAWRCRALGHAFLAGNDTTFAGLPLTTASKRFAQHVRGGPVLPRGGWTPAANGTILFTWQVGPWRISWPGSRLRCW
jgi:hypothetical protein